MEVKFFIQGKLPVLYGSQSAYLSNLPLMQTLLYGIVMKRILVTYKVKDVHWWLTNNTLKQVGEPMGIKFHIFRKTHTNMVGYIAEIPDSDVLDKILLNTTILSDSFKANGVLVETIEMLEEVEN